jgi:hypothetical protein
MFFRRRSSSSAMGFVLELLTDANNAVGGERSRDVVGCGDGWIGEGQESRA